MPPRILISVASAATLFAGAGNAAAQSEAAASACAALEQVSFEAAADNPVRIISATHIEDGNAAFESSRRMLDKRSIVQGMPISGDADIPAHCRIEGYVAPAVKFLLTLPDARNWNGDAVYAACDAFCGEVQEDNVVAGLVHNFATITSDGGHINKRPFDGIWAANNREGEIDFAYRASHVIAQTVKAVAKEYYGRDVEYAYITGFSKGAHAGVMSALKYPEDYNGVLARSPVVNYQDINAVRMPYIYASNTRADGTAILTGADIPLIHKAAINACDEVDGLKDGLIDDPRQCDYDPSVLLCSGADDKDCLNAEQVGVLKKFYAAPTNAKGEVVYPRGLEVGSEKDWTGFLVPRVAGEKAYSYLIASTWLRYAAFDKDPGAGFDWQAFDPARDRKKLDKMKALYDADGTDLRAFRDAGGKMIILHGWGDGAVSALMSIDWYEKLLQDMGEDVPDFARLFLTPGNKHGGSPGDGPNINDSFAALEKWVEQGVEPEAIILRDETRSRPVYPYPLRATYRGEGDVNDAASFAPASPLQETPSLGEGRL